MSATAHGDAARAQERRRVDGILSVNPVAMASNMDLEMQVRPRRIASSTHISDQLSCAHTLTNVDRSAADEMHIDGGITASVAHANVVT